MDEQFEHSGPSPEDSEARNFFVDFFYWSAIVVAVVSMVVTDRPADGSSPLELHFDGPALALALGAAALAGLTAWLARAGLRYVLFPAFLSAAGCIGAFLPRVAFVVGGCPVAFGLIWLIYRNYFDS